MDEHEVPTHVQAEDRVLLWFTFPQLVALTAVAALAYGVAHLDTFGRFRDCCEGGLLQVHHQALDVPSCGQNSQPPIAIHGLDILWQCLCSNRSVTTPPKSPEHLAPVQPPLTSTKIWDLDYHL